MPSLSRRGFLALGAAGVVALGAARTLPSVFIGSSRGPRFVDLAATPTGAGVWALDESGRIHSFGDAIGLTIVPSSPDPNDKFVALAVAPTGAGVWTLDESG